MKCTFSGKKKTKNRERNTSIDIGNGNNALIIDLDNKYPFYNTNHKYLIKIQNFRFSSVLQRKGPGGKGRGGGGEGKKRLVSC
jgi:hypothetical protein